MWDLTNFIIALYVTYKCVRHYNLILLGICYFTLVNTWKRELLVLGTQNVGDLLNVFQLPRVTLLNDDRSVFWPADPAGVVTVQRSCFYFFVISRGNFWSKFSSDNIFVLVCAFVISPSSFKHSAFNFASCFFLIKDASACCSTTRIFSWIALSFEYSFEDLEFDNLEPVNLDGLDLLSFFYSAVSSFSWFWILSLKEKFLSPTSFSKPQLFSVVIIYFYHFLIDLFNQFQYVNQLLKLLPFCCFILMRI